MGTRFRVHPGTWLLNGPRGVVAITAVLFLSLGCRKPAEDGGAVSVPDAIEPPVPTGAGPQTIRGRLEFASRPAHLRQENVPFGGTTVGEESEDHRKYIAGHPVSPQRAIWHFDKLPGALVPTARDAISAKLTCSIFRLAKRTSDDACVVVRAVSHTCPQTPPGRDEGEWHWGDAGVQKNYQKRADGYVAGGTNLAGASPGTADWKAVGQLAEEYGYYEVRLPSVPEHTEVSIDLPVGLLRNALKNKPEVDASGKPKRPLISIYLKCETEGLLLGVAEPDLYLVEQGQEPVNAAGKGYSFADPMGRFSLTFPAEPVRQPPPRDVPVRPDSPVQLAIWEARTATTKFFLSATYAPAELLDATFDLEKWGDGGGSNPHWRVVSRREITLDGQPAKLVEYAATDGMRESVSVFTKYKGAAVSISVNGSAGQTHKSKEAMAFIESFRFTR